MSVRDPRKIYISNIPHGCRERDLGRLFEELGRILLVDYKNKFAFIEYERSNAAADAIHKYDGIEFMGRRLRVEPYCYRGGDRKYRPDQEAHDFRIVVTGVDSFTSWQDLKDFGRTAGRSVTFADIREIEDRNGHRISEGIIEYANTDDYESALEKLNGARLNGARVQSNDDTHERKRFKEHDGGRRRFDGYRGRSRSRDRDFRRHDRKQYGRRRRRSRSRSYSRSHSHHRQDAKYDDDDDGHGRREKKHRRRERSSGSSQSGGKRKSPHSQKSRSVSHHSTKKQSNSRSKSPSRT